VCLPRCQINSRIEKKKKKRKGIAIFDITAYTEKENLARARRAKSRSGLDEDASSICLSGFPGYFFNALQLTGSVLFGSGVQHFVITRL
jgi:glutamate synthase domain-containing protein 3